MLGCPYAEEVHEPDRPDAHAETALRTAGSSAFTARSRLLTVTTDSDTIVGGR